MILRASIIIILQVFLLSCTKHFYKEKEEFKHYSLKNNQEKTTTADSIKRYKLRVDTETGKVIANSTDELKKDGVETTLGNFVCDALKYSGTIEFKTKPDVIIINRGGLRINLPKGEIKISTIFELMPFENEMVMITVSGEKLKQFLPLFIEKKHPFYGMKIKIEKNKITSALINGDDIDNAKTYIIFTSDYLSNGGDSFTFLKDPISFKTIGIKIRDAIIKYCNYLTKNKEQLTPYTDGRIEISE